MKIVLRSGSSRVDLVLDPESVRWRDQSPGARFTFLPNSGLPAPFGRLFVKRIANQRAPGHELLMSCLERPIRCAPIFSGYGQQDNWHYYVSGLLDRVVGLELVFSASQYRQDLFVKRGLISAMLNNSLAVFQEVGRRGFFYPDFCYRNLMGRPPNGSVLVIDMDSCRPLSPNRLPSGTRVDPTWWGLYFHTGKREVRLLNPEVRLLNPSMIMSMALVLCAALAIFESVPGVTNLAKSVLAGRPNYQSRLFEIFDRADARAFHKVFRPQNPAAADLATLFGLWRQLTDAFRRNGPFDWLDVQRFVGELLSSSGRGHQA